jgi:hypothetical protein
MICFDGKLELSWIELKYCDRIGGILINVIVLSEKDREFDPWMGKSKGVFVASPLSIEGKGQILPRNQDNVSELGDMYIPGKLALNK